MTNVTDASALELVLDAKAEIGEGPVWDDHSGELVWVDIPAGLVHRTKPDGTDTVLDVDRPVGSVGLRHEGGLVLATSDGFRLQDQGSTETRLIAAVEADDDETRMNDGWCDPAGRFYAGTMGYSKAPGLGALYRLDPDGTATTVVSDVTISNGLDWADDGMTMYYIDTPTQGLDAFDWDRATGDLSNRRRVIDFPPAGGAPDGLKIDSEGTIWIAFWGGWAVRRFTADGRLLAEIRLPVSHVTSIAFGGDDLGDLYITSAWSELSPAERAAEPLAGALFRIRPGVLGRPSPRFDG
ncbi:MAG TPA: SMP-30/gluconolactonase/LRE family protein [Candidatus Acidoferrum sp.]|nr:SMP-30/gluconolactonase/LRE family protein [Candidatus Acidoferrum sp.]